ncbi:MAG: non-ribosomal peptide synthetase, partial [bacterium]|nr:non-ribosomal peptide synthetase [bacterium]
GLPVPLGVPGELAIGGAGVARGYLNRPELTAERFVPDAYFGDRSTGPNLGGRRLYRSGDLVRWLADGEIEFLGRIDHQVKIRGLRIELGEIEAALSRSRSVRECSVLVREATSGDLQLVAFVATAPGSAADPQALRSFLQEQLPAYMVPSAFVALDALPLLPSGKVDRAALGRRPLPAQGRMGEGVVALSGPTEELLAGIWADVLGATGPACPPVGARDNFFELGGHSLLATQVISRVREHFGVELPL